MQSRGKSLHHFTFGTFTGYFSSDGAASKAGKGLTSNVRASDDIALRRVACAVLPWHFIGLRYVILWYLCITD